MNFKSKTKKIVHTFFLFFLLLLRTKEKIWQTLKEKGEASSSELFLQIFSCYKNYVDCWQIKRFRLILNN